MKSLTWHSHEEGVRMTHCKRYRITPVTINGGPAMTFRLTYILKGKIEDFNTIWEAKERAQEHAHEMRAESLKVMGK